MKKIAPLISCILALLASAPGRGAEPAAAPELLYKVCFPPEKSAFEPYEECKNEDCGLAEEAEEDRSPRVEKGIRYKFLGAADQGMIWGANTYRVIGDDRVRFLLYVVEPTSTKTVYEDRGYDLIPKRVIRTAFFSTFGEYRGSSVSVSYDVLRKVERREEVSGGGGAFEMVDLHCSAKKLKLYDNHTIFYRTVAGGSQGGQCAELLWEKPQKPLRWQPASSVLMGVLSDYYCRKSK